MELFSKIQLLVIQTFPELDDKMVFDAEDTDDNQVLAIINLQDDKINGVDNTEGILINGGKWGTWFAPGERMLTSTNEDILLENEIQIFTKSF